MALRGITGWNQGMLWRLPGVYPPQADTWLLADVLRLQGLVAGHRVLDVCTGTGALAIAAACAGAASVTAVDLSSRAALTTWLNSRLQGLPVRVLRGDLFTCVAGELFDVVLANPPYVPAHGARLPRHRIGRSWDAGPDGRALLDRICSGVPGVLAEGGTLLLTQSAVADEGRTLEQLERAGLPAVVRARVVQPFGPVLRQRAALLEARGCIAPGQREEELVVIEARSAACIWSGVAPR
jgi:release factor glutamine methyltransferase